MHALQRTTMPTTPMAVTSFGGLLGSARRVAVGEAKLPEAAEDALCLAMSKGLALRHVGHAVEIIRKRILALAVPISSHLSLYSQVQQAG
jgi:hypothetical protein